MGILFYQNIAIKLCKYINLKMNKVPTPCFSQKSLFGVYTIIIFYLCGEIYCLNGMFIFSPHLYFLVNIIINYLHCIYKILFKNSFFKQKKNIYLPLQ